MGRRRCFLSMLAFQFLLFRFLPCSWFGFCVSYLLQVFFCNVCRAFCTVHLLSFSVPAGAGGAAGKRRHSYQSGVPGLAKDMDRLRVSAAAANAANQGVNQGRSPRGSTRRRASSARRSSRSGKIQDSIFHSYKKLIKVFQAFCISWIWPLPIKV